MLQENHTPEYIDCSKERLVLLHPIVENILIPSKLSLNSLGG